MEYYIICTCIIGIITTIYLFFKYRFTYWENRGVTHLPPLIPYGSLKNVGKTKHIIAVFDEVYSTFKKKAPFSGLYVSIIPVAVITDLDLVRNVLIKDFSNFNNRPFFYNERDDPLSAHLFSIEGQKWRRIRSLLTPTFTSGKMKFMYPTLVDVSEKFLGKLNEVANGTEVIEMKDLLARYTTDIIGRCAFGIECNSLKDPNAEFRLAGRKVFEDYRHGRVVQEILNQFPKFFAKLGVKLYKDGIESFFIGAVEETITLREKNKIRRNDFMDLLIEIKNNERDNLTIKEIAAQAFVFFLAGFETSSTAMSYSLYELALNPDIQVKARCEISEVVAKHNGQLTYEAVMDMKYIGQILNESLRKYPPLPLLTRKASNNYQVPGTDKIIEKGTTVVVPVYSIHHDPEIYPNPEVFDPNRFLPEHEKTRDPMSFMAFGDGPRNCIGLRFGQMQSRIGLITIIQNFHVKTCKETSIPWEFLVEHPVLLAPKGGLYLHLEKI